MKLSFCLLVCLGAAFANIRPYEQGYTYLDDYAELGQNFEDQKEFRHGREFKFIYNGQVMTGIPGTSKQHSGNRIQAKVTFVCKHHETCVMKIDQVRMGKLNRRVRTPRHVLPMDTFEEVPLEHRQRRKLHLPIKFSINNGLVSDIFFDGRDKPWSANIKRGILNMIQVDLERKRKTSSVDVVQVIEDDVLDIYKPTEHDAKFYRRMEKTIEGECETLYTVTKPQIRKVHHEDVYNVTKTINFEKCIKRPQVKYNFHFADDCPTCDTKYVEDQKFLKSSSIASYQVIKTPRMNIIKHAHTESEYIFVPFNEEANAIVTYISQNLKLIKTGPVFRRVQVPMYQLKSDSDMLYTLDYDIARETFNMHGDTTSLEKSLFRKHQHHKNIERVINLLQKLVNNIKEKVEQPATKHYILLVNALRLLTKPQLEKVHYLVKLGGEGTLNKFSFEQRKKADDLLHDAMASAGTKHCVKHLVEKIKRREMPVIRAYSVIRNLDVMKTPSKEIIEELISLAESPVCRQHYMLKQTTWLTVGALMKALCSNHADQWAREFKEDAEQQFDRERKFCPRNLKEKYVKILIKKLQSSHKWENQLIYIKALGNSGIDLSVFELEKIIQNRNYHYRTLVRVEAVLALHNLKRIMPKKVQRVLIPIASNKMQPDSLRITAAYMILQTLPSRPVIDQLAKLVHDEKNIQVAAFIDSYMHSVANSTNPCEKKLATDLRLSLRQTHKIFAKTLGHSKFMRVPMHSEHQKVGLDLDLATVFTDRKSIPRQLAATLHSNFLGFWNKYLVSFRLATEGLDKLLRRAYGRYGYFEGIDSFLQNDYENILDSMDIFGQKQRDPMSRDPKVVFNVKTFNKDMAFFPIKREALETMLALGQPLTPTGVYFEEKLRRGVHVNFNKGKLAKEIFYKIPTTIGMPVIVNIKVPVVLNVHGVVKLIPGASGNLGAFEVKAILKPSLVASVSVDVECWNPIVTTGVNVKAHLKTFTPIDAKLFVDIKRPTKIVKLLFKPPTHRKDLITVESHPVTFTLVQPTTVLPVENRQKRLIINEEGVRTRTVHNCGTCSVLGIKFCVKGRYHKTPEERIVGTPFLPLSGPNRIVITAEPTFDRPHTVAINLYGKFLKPLTSWDNEFSFGGLSAQQRFLSIITGEETFDATFGRGLHGHGLFNPLLEGEQLFDPLMAESAAFNKYPTINPLTKHKNLKRPLVNSFRLEVDAPRRHTVVDFVHVFNLDGDYHKVQAKIARSPCPERPQPFKLCLNGESIFPSIQMVRQLPNGHILGKLFVNWGRTCNSPNYIRVVKRLEKGASDKLYELENFGWNVHRDANLYHDELLKKSPIKFIFNVNYNNVPLYTKHYANEVLRYLKKHHYDQTNVAEVGVQNRPKHVKIIVAVDPITLKKSDVLIKTPKSNTLIRDITLPKLVRLVTHEKDYAKNEWKSLTQERLIHPTAAQCYATEYKVKTFHDNEVPLPLTSTYKLLAKDCQANKYTVLVRQLPDYRNLKEVKIHTNLHKITLKPSQTRDDRVKIFINGKDYTNKNDILKTEAGIPVLRVIRQSSHVKVEILDAKVMIHFDRKSVHVEVPPYKKHNQCGICGGRGWETFTEGLTTPFIGRLGEQMEIERELGYLGREEEQQQFFGQLGLENTLLRDYTTTDDVMSYYFNVRPTFDNVYEKDFLLEDELLRREESRFETPAWTKREDKQWEINQLSTGDVIRKPYEYLRQLDLLERDSIFEERPYESLRDLELINSEFDSYYTPLANVERDWLDIDNLYGGLNTERPFELINELAEEQYLKNPYLRQNYLINEESCQYKPFWEREIMGCGGAYSTLDNVFDYETKTPFLADRFDRLDTLGRLEEREIFGGGLINEPVYERELLLEDEFRRELGDDERTLRNTQAGTYTEEMVERAEEEQAWSKHAGKKQKVVETEHSICFSQTPVRCADGSRPREQVEKVVPYHCVSRRNPLAEKWHNELLSGRHFIPHVAQSTPTMTRLEVVPLRCEPNF